MKRRRPPAVASSSSSSLPAAGAVASSPSSSSSPSPAAGAAASWPAGSDGADNPIVRIGRDYRQEVRRVDNLLKIPEGSRISLDDMFGSKKSPEPSSTFVSNLHNLPNHCEKDRRLLHAGPRRMGKSTHLQIMKAYLEGDERVRKHLIDVYGYTEDQLLKEKHPVIFVTLDIDVPAEYNVRDIEADMDRKLVRKLCGAADDLGMPEFEAAARNVEATFKRLLKAIAKKYTEADGWGHPSVLIDETSAVLQRAICDGVTDKNLLEQRAEGILMLFGIIKSVSDIHSVFSTGLTLLYLQYATASQGTNIFTNITFCRGDDPLALPLGFTWEQIEETFGNRLEIYCQVTGRNTQEGRVQVRKELTEWYDGFVFGPGWEPRFNTKSVLEFFRTGELRAHWTGAAGDSSKSVLEFVSKETVAKLLEAASGAARPITIPINQAKMSDCMDLETDRASLEIAYLLQMGDVSVAPCFGGANVLTVTLPNLEISTSVLPALFERVSADEISSSAFVDLLRTGKVKEFLEMQSGAFLSEVFKCLSSDSKSVAAGAATATVLEPVVSCVAAFHISTLSKAVPGLLHKDFAKVTVEGAAGRHRSDIRFALNNGGNPVGIVIETKRVPSDNAVEGALDAALCQIDKNNYAGVFEEKGWQVRKIAAVYSHAGVLLGTKEAKAIPVPQTDEQAKRARKGE